MRNIFINAYRKKARHQVVFDATPNDFLMDSNQSAISNHAESSLQMKEIESAIHYLPSIFEEPLYCTLKDINPTKLLIFYTSRLGL
jgi:hypothetical protein